MVTAFQIKTPNRAHPKRSLEWLHAPIPLGRTNLGALPSEAFPGLPWAGTLPALPKPRLQLGWAGLGVLLQEEEEEEDGHPAPSWPELVTRAGPACSAGHRPGCVIDGTSLAHP